MNTFSIMVLSIIGQLRLDMGRWLVIRQLFQFYFMNQFSIKTRNTNLLRTKTNNFKQNHQQSENRIKASSSLNNLAGKIYSNTYNEGFSPSKSRIVAQSASKVKNNKSAAGGLNPQLPLISPEKLMKSTLSMSGLSMRASHIPSFSEVNTQLLIEKKTLQNEIAALKHAIAHEKKLLNQADYNSKRNMNDNNKFTDFYKQANSKSKVLNEKIHHTKVQIEDLELCNFQLNEQIKVKHENIKQEKNNCDMLDREVRNLKANCLQTEKQRNQLKADLQKAQRIMQSSAIYCKQLENQRAVLLLSINQSVLVNKL